MARDLNGEWRGACPGEYVRYKESDHVTVYGIIDQPVPGQPNGHHRVVTLAALGPPGHGFSAAIVRVKGRDLTIVKLDTPLDEIFPTVADLFVTTVLLQNYEWDGSNYLMENPFLHEEIAGTTNSVAGTE